MKDDRDSLRGPPPVEPLGELGWARIERAVWAELDAAPSPESLVPARSRKAMWIAIGVSAAAAAAAAGVFALSRGDAPAPVVAQAPAAPQWVVTGAGSSEVTFGDARIAVAPRSAVVLNGGADDGVLVVIDRGAADFEVAPRVGRPKFVVQAGEVSVRVIGTGFRVERVGDGAKVAVSHGTVEVVTPGETARVTAGETWPSELAAGTAAPDAGLGEPSADLDMDPIAVGRDHPRAPKKPAPAQTAPQDARPAPAIDDDARRFAAATAIEAGDPIAALVEYRRLASGDGPWAANALYAEGRLLYERRDDDAARAALTEYLHRFPRGANAADARALISRLQGASR
jgi:hypothetical protein